MNTIKVGVIGLGSMGRNHVRVLQSLKNVELVVGADPTLPEFDFPVVATVDELLGYEINYAVIAVPTKFHCEVAIKCAESNVDFLIEKPVSSSIEECKLIQKAVKRNCIAAAVGHIERYNPVIMAIKDLLPTCGNIQHITTMRNGFLEPERRMPEGVVYDLLVHDVDIVRYLTGQEYTSLRKTRSFKSSVAGNTFCQAKGVIKTFTTSHEVSWMDTQKARGICIITDTSYIVADLVNKELCVNGSVYDFSKHKEALVTEHKEFIKWLEFKSNNVVSLSEGIQAVKIIERMEAGK